MATSTSASSRSTRSNGNLAERLISEKDDFHKNRSRCVWNPKRAVETLGPCAKLEMRILSAHRLLSFTPAHTYEPPRSPYVKVFIDDVEAFETNPATTSPPRWHKDGKVDVTALQSMVRIQVFDHSKPEKTADVGFVEFRVGELPWDKTITGWFELRFHDMLEKTSSVRYASHRTMRDEEHEENHEVRQSLLKPPGIGCMSACTRSNFTSQQRNAGELMMRLRFVRLGSWSDAAFALALDPRPEKHFIPKVEKVPAKGDLPELNLQSMGDDITDMKLTVVDGAVVSTVNFVGYMLAWRSSLWSFLVTAALVASWIFPILTWIVVPALLAVTLLLLSNKGLRKEMTTAGTNAPLSQEGFESVARWQNTSSMSRFLRRIVEKDLQGKVTSDEDLKALAAHCFSEDKPKVNYRQLRDSLKGAKFTLSTKDGLSPGALVVVQDSDGHRRAMVQRIDDSKVNVKYDDGPEQSVDSSKVTPRPLAPPVPTWIVPDALSTHIRSVSSHIASTKKSLLGPIQRVKQVITWKQPQVTGLVVVALLVVSALELSTQVHLWGKVPMQIESGAIAVAAAVMEWVKFLFHWGLLALGVVLLTYQAPFTVCLRSTLRILLRLLTMRRRAPANWPFFREGSAGP